VFLGVLRGLTLLVRLALAVAAVAVAVRIRHGVPRPLQHGWAVAAAAFSFVTLSTLALEGLVVGAWLGGPDVLLDLRFAMYNEAYLTAGIAFAVLPALLLVVFSPRAWVRMIGAVVAAAACIVGLASALGAGGVDWDSMLGASRFLSFLSIAAYLLFCALYLLGQLPLVDWRLGGIVITETVFELTIPIPELFFQAAGRQDASTMWGIIQVMQLVAAAAQLGFVWSAVRALRRGGPAGLLRRPFAA